MAINRPDYIRIKGLAKRPILSIVASFFIITISLIIATPVTAATDSQGALAISMESTSARAMGSLKRRFGQVNDLLYLYSVNETATVIEVGFPGELIVAPDKTKLADLLTDATTDIRINVEPVVLAHLFDPEAAPAAKVVNKQKQIVGIIATQKAMEPFRTGAVVRSSHADEGVRADKNTAQAVSHPTETTSDTIDNAHSVAVNQTEEAHPAAEPSGHAQPVANQTDHDTASLPEEKTAAVKTDPSKMPDDPSEQPAGHSSDEKQVDDHNKNTEQQKEHETAAHPETPKDHPETPKDKGHDKDAHGTTFDASLPRGVALIEAITQPMNYELNERFWGWRPNDLIRIGDNVKNFQLGVLEITRRTAIILSERVSRTGESSRFDPQLENAMNWLMIKPNRYWFPSAESKYQDALDALTEYKARLAKKQAKFFNRADNLIPLLMAYEDLLGSCEENLVKMTEEDGSSVSFYKSDDYLFYTKGVTSALLTILKAIEHDFGDVIASRQAQGDIHHAITSCHHAIEIDPVLIMNSHASSIFANHRANQAAPISHARFYLSVLIKTLST